MDVRSMLVGLRPQVSPPGDETSVRLTMLAKLLTELAVMVDMPVSPTFRDNVVGLAESVKSGCATELTSIFTVTV
jgi:hypothetical protein